MRTLLFINRVAVCGAMPILTRNVYGFSICLAVKIVLRLKDSIETVLKDKNNMCKYKNSILCTKINLLKNKMIIIKNKNIIL